MVNYAFVLIPLYIYPEKPTTWQPLYTAAQNHPSVTFQVVVNPNSGPGASSCPNGNDTNYINSIATLNAIPNIKTLGYIHTATSPTACNGICVCTQPQSALQANISTYQNWPTAGCSNANNKDIHVDGIFMDEAPTNSSCLSYMRDITSYAKKTMTRGNTVLFNAGVAIQESGYWGIADYINIFENNEAALRTVNVTQLTGDGEYAEQSTMIVYGYGSGTEKLQEDVQDLLSINDGEGIAGLYINDLSTFAAFPTILDAFVKDVGVVGGENAK